MDLELVKWAVGQGGGWAALIVVGYFYRRDHLRKQHGLQDAHRRRDDREERFIAAIQQLAGALGTLSKDLAHHHEIEVAALDRVENAVDQVGHDVKNVLLRVSVRS